MRSPAVVFCFISLPLAAQAPVPKLYLAPDLVIPSAQIKVGVSRGGTRIHVGPAGQMVLEKDGYGDIRAFDSTGKSLDWKTKSGGRDDEIGYTNHYGWMGSTFWLNDMRFKQVVLLDQQGEVRKSLEHPTWIHPRWADRRKYPLFGYADVVGVLPDTSLVVHPGGPRSVLDTPGFDRSLAYVMHVDQGGAILHVVDKYDGEEGRLTLEGQNRLTHTMLAPFFGRTWREASPDGRRYVVVAPGVTMVDSGSFRVTSINENGDTLFSRRYEYPAVRIPRRSIDSALARVGPFGNYTGEQARARLARMVPTFKSFVAGALVGLDHSTWVLLRPLSDTARTRDALILDDRGERMGLVHIPDTVTPSAVDHAHLWGVDRAQNQALVRMRLQATLGPRPARPPRSVRASRGRAPAPQ